MKAFGDAVLLVLVSSMLVAMAMAFAVVFIP